SPISDVQFFVTESDGTVVGNSNGYFTTDSAGTILIDNIDPGTTLVAKEVKAKEGFLLDDTPQTAQIKAGQTVTLEFRNKPMGNLIIHKLSSTNQTPLEGVQFKITYADGSYLPDEGGKLSSNGLYWTDSEGQIVLSNITGTIVATEVQSVSGYTIDPNTQSQTVVVNPDDTQELWFYNDPVGGVEIIKVDEADQTQRLANATFEIRKMDDALVDTVTVDQNGRVFLPLEDGAYYALEVTAPEGYKLDDTPHYFEVKDGKTIKLTITNRALSGILIHKTDESTGEGIYGVSFLLYDSSNTPIGQYTSDDRGYVYIEDLEAGRYYLRELENEGYVPDTQKKTVYVKSGETTEVEWENTPITGQIQITKTSADYNSMNGWPAGTPIPNTVFEIYNYRTGKLVDTIKTDRNGVAVSRPLPLGRYKIVEAQAAEFYGLDKTPIEVELEFAGQIVKTAMTNKSLYTNVSIKKTGYVEVMPGQSIRYDFSGIANNSTTSLTSFYWRDTLPTQAVRLDKIITGTYNANGSYKVVYQTNLSGGTWRTMYDNLLTSQNYTLDASPAALGLASNEYVTAFMVSFGVVPANFRQVEAPRVYCNVVSQLAGGTQFTNQADVGGVYDGQWIMATSRWVTKVYKPSQPLPRTGY
ncbi:MSCRAMM family protein, partial [Intestinimonas massiliensis (ex Afouda et al. 2020)]|uniref:MSCRAMM family protein n=1 Tax=Intestinimonas massiliensis (ex Afouda et al. 2020) TaxID=1673721 RepID=UPI0024150B1C